jgi:hypothetical protein
MRDAFGELASPTAVSCSIRMRSPVFKRPLCV